MYKHPKQRNGETNCHETVTFEPFPTIANARAKKTKKESGTTYNDVYSDFCQSAVQYSIVKSDRTPDNSTLRNLLKSVLEQTNIKHSFLARTIED